MQERKDISEFDKFSIMLSSHESSIVRFLNVRPSITYVQYSNP